MSKGFFTKSCMCVLATSLLMGCSMGPSTYGRNVHTSKNYSYNSQPESSDKVWHPSKKDSIPSVMNPSVKKWVKLFNGKLKPNFDRWVQRLGSYGPTIEQVLMEEQVPRDLIYLAMIESGFNLSAASHAAAVGPWQFIASTGRNYGLNNNYFIEERQDLVQSTHAAARHLKDLYKVYGDWYLAFAAYNAGSGKVNGAIRHLKTKDYWKLSAPHSRYLRQETKDYVPKILAAMHIVKNYKQFGYTEKSFNPPLRFEKVTVPDATDINVIAQAAGTSVEVIQTLNTSLVIGITPPDTKMTIYIPRGTKEKFEKNYARIPSSERVSYLHYRAGRNETIYSVAKTYNVSAEKLAKLNKINAHKKLRSGHLIKIPANKSVLLALAKTGPAGGSASTKKYYHKVRSGETLTKIARKYNTSATKVVQWNHLKKNTKLKVGQKLAIYKTTSSGSPMRVASFVPSQKKKKLTGVTNIILQNNEEPILVASHDSKVKNIIVPKMVAIESEENPIHDQPATIIQPTPEKVASNSEEKQNEATSQARATQYHLVKKGDSLSSIAVRYKLGIKELKSINHLQSDKIRTNQKLLVTKTTLQAKVPREQTLASNLTSKPSQSIIVHHVKSGETLWSLSKKYNVKISDIMKWNKMKDNQVRPKQKIKIFAITDANKEITATL